MTFSTSLKKIIFIVENVVFLLKYHTDRRLRKGSRSSHRSCSIREGIVPGSFFNEVTSLRPATLLKKKLWRSCFSFNNVKFLVTLFYRTSLGGCFWSSNDPLFFYGDLYRRFYISPSSVNILQ